MYDDGNDDDGGRSGLGGAVWYQLGRWAEQSAQEEHRFLDNLRARFARTFQRPEGRIYIDDYNNLMAWYRRALKLEKQVQQLHTSVRQHQTQQECWALLHYTENKLRLLAEQGYTNTNEYVELSELQRAAEDEFMRTGRFDTDHHQDRTVPLLTALGCKFKE